MADGTAMHIQFVLAQTNPDTQDCKTSFVTITTLHTCPTIHSNSNSNMDDQLSQVHYMYILALMARPKMEGTGFHPSSQGGDMTNKKRRNAIFP